MKSSRTKGTREMRRNRLASTLAALLAALSTSGQTPVAEAIRSLRSGNAQERRQASRELGRLGAGEAAPALLKALRDRDAGVRAEAAKALGSIRHASAVQSLVNALTDPDVNVRVNAAYALGELRAGEAGQALLKALRDPSWHVRDQAAWALRGLRSPQVADRIMALLDEPGVDVESLVWILRETSPERTTTALRRMLSVTDAEVRVRAIRLLSDCDVPGQTELLVAALRDEAVAVRLPAVEALAERQPDGALEPLRSLLAAETDARIRTVAEHAVRRLVRAQGLAAHWSFDDGDTAVAKDVTGWGLDGAIKNAKPSVGKVGKALHFGGDAVVSMGMPADLPIAQQEISLTAWINAEKGTGVVVARGGAWCGYSLHIRDGRAAFGIHRMKDGPAYIATGTRNIVGKWTHLAAIIREKRLELYVDGQLEGTAKTAGFIPGNCGQGMDIGHDTGDSAVGITGYFVGIIDEVRAYSIGLSADQIAKQYEAQNHEKTEP